MYPRKLLGLVFLVSLLSSCKSSVDDPEYILLTQRAGSGMFSELDDILALVKKFDDGSLKGARVDFGKDGPYYDAQHGDNWWTYYFEPINLGVMEGVKITKTGDISYKHNATVEFSGASRQEVNGLIKKYFHLKPFVDEKINTFVEQNFKNHYVIGIHYRGTDKVKEAPRTAYDKIIEAVEEARAKAQASSKIFVATDESQFLEYMKSKYGDKVVYVAEAIRSEDGTPVHLSGNNGYRAGENALVDCLLLSKTNYLIRTSSNLSRWATYFNPDLPVNELSKRY